MKVAASKAVVRGNLHRGFESLLLRQNYGAVVQMGECFPRTEEVTGSSPVCSTKLYF